MRAEEAREWAGQAVSRDPLEWWSSPGNSLIRNKIEAAAGRGGYEEAFADLSPAEQLLLERLGYHVRKDFARFWVVSWSPEPRIVNVVEPKRPWWKLWVGIDDILKRARRNPKP